MRVERVINIAELRRLALRRLPRLLGDWVEGGAEDEQAVRRNLEQFRRFRLVPRYLVDVSAAATTTVLFGRTYGCPFGIAPTGYPGLFRPGGDLLLARAAAAANVPFIMSGAATATVEDVARAAPDHGWFQLYAARDEAINRDLVARAAAAGLAALVVTVDVPAEPKRERDLRNGFAMPFVLTPRIVADGLMHPAWTARYFRAGGLPVMANWAPYAPKGAGAEAVALFATTQFHATLTWRDIERIRAAWPRTLVVKGILAADDARRAQAAGVDGIIVSNHGGRQGDRLPAPLEVLPAILDAAPGLTVMMDGGVRRGADIVTALGLGARFVFVGRATLFGLTVAGQAGVARAIAILRDEMLITLRQLGRPTIEGLTWDVILDTGIP
ncbi:MAG: alpha-hydroxy acid oxidase [Alphaproteobacteria bacterium]